MADNKPFEQKTMSESGAVGAFHDIWREFRAMKAKIARLEAALRPFANEPLSTEPAYMKTRLWSVEDYDAKIQAARDALNE